MKTTCTALLLIANTLFAQDLPTGEAAAAAVQQAKKNSWQNWIVGGGLALAAVIGITVVMLNTGSSPSSHS